MKVDRFSLPLASPLATASGTIEAREGFVVSVDHRGETGVGEATPLPGWTESVRACESALERAGETLAADGNDAALLELDPDRVPAARHGLATALADADARVADVALYRWFDGERRCDSVPVNATVGDGSTEETVAAAVTAVADGFDCLKLKVAARSVDADVERVRAVRRSIGDAVTIRLDANGNWDRRQAGEAFDSLEPLDVAYVEQPLEPTDLEGLAALRNRGDRRSRVDRGAGAVGVAVDESLVDCRTADVFAAGAADAIVLKPMVLGGPGTAYTLAMRARAEGMEPIVSNTVDAVVARTAAVHVAAAIPDVAPCGLATADRLASDLAADPAPVSDGTATVPQVPGLGIDPGEIKA